MNHIILENHNHDILFWLTNLEEVEVLQEMLDRPGGYLDHEWFGEYFCNGEFEFILPEEIGALTGDGNPIFGSVDRDEHTDEITRIYALWAYDMYQIRYAIQELLDNGTVTFQNYHWEPEHLLELSNSG